MEAIIISPIEFRVPQPVSLVASYVGTLMYVSTILSRETDDMYCTVPLRSVNFFYHCNFSINALLSREDLSMDIHLKDSFLCANQADIGVLQYSL